MNIWETYVFWFPNGKSVTVLREENERQAFENFLKKILTREQLTTREQMRYMEYAIKIAVDDIMKAYED